MVEIMNQNNHQEMLKLPKNIRQIGLPEEKKKIYVEDYVVTYMNQLAMEYPNQQNAAVLLGFYTKQKDVRLTFINGAIGIPTAKVEDDQISFGSELWEDIYNTIRKYFPKSEVIGWFLTRPGKSLGINEKITKIHVDQFPGKEKTLFLMDPLDKEEAFFIYEGAKLTRQQGYYIYYERNEEMQNYMIDHQKGKGTEELLEAANLKKMNSVHKPAKKTVKKDSNKKTESRPFGVHLMATVIAALTLVVVGMNVMNYFYTPKPIQTMGENVGEEPLTVKIEEAINETENIWDEGETKNDLEVNADAGIHYTVRKGDTLVNICIGLYDSQEYVDMICEMNGIEDPDLIYEGMVLELP